MQQEYGCKTFVYFSVVAQGEPLTESSESRVARKTVGLDHTSQPPTNHMISPGSSHHATRSQIIRMRS
jgi:hypothetical protein